jgi:SAM-dependent methyltransferase
MGYFDIKKNVIEYIKMTRDYDGRDLIKVLKKHLEKSSHVLELGMGPGKDLEILNESFRVTGSDSSKIFLDLYRKKHRNADLILLDAVKMDTPGKFDCIYSNKVLIHLSKSELLESFKNQNNVLKDNGILFHSFWYGDKEEEHNGLRFVYYNENSLQRYYQDFFETVEITNYKELEENDSLLVVLRKKDLN